MKDSILLVFALACGTAGCTWAFSPIIDGATSELAIRVVDDSSIPVTDAEVSVVFYVKPEKVDVHRGLTDTNGLFKTKGRSIGEIHVIVKKDGYYQGRVLPKFRLLSVEEATAARRWAMGEVLVPVVLKKIRDPARLVRNGGKETWRRVCYPSTNFTMGFDLLAYDWCPPFGKGKHADFQIQTEFWRSEKDYLTYRNKTIISMTNAMDGFYFADVDPTSAFRYAYEADPHAQFAKELRFEIDRRNEVVATDKGMPRGKYIVFRTRTITDPKGNVLSANYGMIAEKMSALGNLSMICIFNPEPNDLRLEPEADWNSELAPFDREDYP